MPTWPTQIDTDTTGDQIAVLVARSVGLLVRPRTVASTVAIPDDENEEHCQEDRDDVFLPEKVHDAHRQRKDDHFERGVRQIVECAPGERESDASPRQVRSAEPLVASPLEQPDHEDHVEGNGGIGLVLSGPWGPVNAVLAPVHVAGLGSSYPETIVTVARRRLQKVT